MRLCGFCLVLMMSGCNKITFLSEGIGGKRKPVPPAIADNEESFLLGKARRSPLDILLVIDNSDSMAEVHRGLADKLGVLLGEVADNDWKIALTTTDTRDCPQTFSAATPNYKHAFRSTIGKLGTGGTFLEQASRAAILGLQKDCSGKGWLRANSAVAVLIITDEDNFKLGKCGDVDTSGLNVPSPLADRECHISALHSYLQKIRVVGITAKVYGLINTEDSKNFLEKVDNGKHIFAHYDSVHSKDYRATLRKISQHIHAVLQNRFVLQQTHPDKSAKVYITSGGKEKMLPPATYTLSGNILTIDNTAMPAKTHSVKVVWSATVTPAPAPSRL